MCNNNTKVVRIDGDKYYLLRVYAAARRLKIVDIVNEAVENYMNSSIDFIEFKQYYFLTNNCLDISNDNSQR